MFLKQDYTSVQFLPQIYEELKVYHEIHFPFRTLEGSERYYLHVRSDPVKYSVSKVLLLERTFRDSPHMFMYSGDKVFPEWKFGCLN